MKYSDLFLGTFLVCMCVISVMFAGCLATDSNPQTQNLDFLTNNSYQEKTISVDSDSSNQSKDYNPDLVQCQNLKIIDQASCLSDLAISKNNLSICNLLYLNDTSRQQLISDYCIAKFATYKKDISICSFTKEESLNEACILDIADVLNDSNLCENITNDQVRFKCYNAMAVSRNDTSICEKISDSNLSLFCFARLSGNISYCANISDLQVYNECNLLMAFKNPDLSICEKISDDYFYDACLTYVALNMSNESICEGARIKEDIQNCRNELVISYAFYENSKN